MNCSKHESMSERKCSLRSELANNAVRSRCGPAESAVKLKQEAMAAIKRLNSVFAYVSPTSKVVGGVGNIYLAGLINELHTQGKIGRAESRPCLEGTNSRKRKVSRLQGENFLKITEVNKI